MLLRFDLDLGRYINQPVDVLVRTSHLFAPLPDAMRDDMAFIDRLHYYLPGWEVPKMSTDLLTEGYGFVVDYLHKHPEYEDLVA